MGGCGGIIAFVLWIFVGIPFLWALNSLLGFSAVVLTIAAIIYSWVERGNEGRNRIEAERLEVEKERLKLEKEREWQQSYAPSPQYDYVYEEPVEEPLEKSRVYTAPKPPAEQKVHVGGQKPVEQPQGSVNVVCVNCGQANKVPASLLSRASCGKCGTAYVR